jgi:hypothetical protein
MFCFLVGWTINLSLEISNILVQNFCCTIHGSCVVAWYDDRSIFLFKSRIYAMKSLVRTIRMSCGIPWYDERSFFVFKSAIDLIRTFVALLICHVLFQDMTNDHSLFSNAQLYSIRSLVRIIHLSCVVSWYDERSICLLKSAIYSIKSLLRTFHLSCVVAWYDERYIFLFKLAIYSIRSLLSSIHLSCVVPWYDER